MLVLPVSLRKMPKADSRERSEGRAAHQHAQWSSSNAPSVEAEAIASAVASSREPALHEWEHATAPSQGCSKPSLNTSAASVVTLTGGDSVTKRPPSCVARAWIAITPLPLAFQFALHGADVAEAITAPFAR
jgi:hypothetical protein